MTHAPRKKNNWLRPILGVVLLSVFLLPQFSMAQEIVLNKDSYKKAQESEAECLKFKDAVYNLSGGKFKASWRKDGLIWPHSCVISEATAGESFYSSRSLTSLSLEQAIQNSEKGLSATAISTAARQDELEQTQAGPVSKIIGWVINAILSVVASVIGIFTTIAGEIMVTAIRWSTEVTIMPDIVNVGWAIVRDFANMFFILIMIVIAIAAILRIEEYDYRHLLGEVVIMAILVNFSKVIAVTLINLANTLVTMFAFHDLWDVFGFVYRVAWGNSMSLPSGGWMSAMVQGLTKIGFMLVALASFIALAGLFTVRLVGLYVLVIFSPIAYVFDILPATKNLAHQWWHKFIEYLIWAPVAMFMLRLAKLIVQGGGLQLSGFVDGLSTTVPQNDSVFNYVILMGFLWGAVMIAEHAGMVGGNAIVHGVEHAGHWAGHRLQHWAGRHYNEWSYHKFGSPTEGKPLTRAQRMKFALVNPVAAYKGWSKRGEKLAHHAQALAAARGEEWANVLFTGTTLPETQFVERAHTNEMLKSLLPMRKEQLASIMVQFEGVKGHEGEVMRNAGVTAMLANGYTDDVLRMKHFAEKYGEIRDKLDEKGNVITDNEGNPVKQLVTYSPEIINRFLYDYMSGPPDEQGHKHAMSEQSLRILGEDAEELGKRTHHPEVIGHAVYDPNLKAFRNTMRESGREIPTVSGKMVKEIINDPDDELSMHNLSIGEWKKDGGRGTIATATHGMQPQVFDLNTVVNDRGQVNYQFVDKGDMLSETFQWGSPDAIPGSEAYYGGIMGVVGSAQGMREVQHAQQRLRDGMLAAQMDQQGRLIFKTANDVRKIMKNLKYANDLGRALYGQKLNVMADQRNDIKNIKYIIQKPDGTVEREGKIKFNDQHSDDSDWTMDDIDKIRNTGKKK